MERLSSSSRSSALTARPVRAPPRVPSTSPSLQPLLPNASIPPMGPSPPSPNRLTSTSDLLDLSLPQEANYLDNDESGLDPAVNLPQPSLPSSRESGSSVRRGSRPLPPIPKQSSTLPQPISSHAPAARHDDIVDSSAAFLGHQDSGLGAPRGAQSTFPRQPPPSMATTVVPSTTTSVHGDDEMSADEDARPLLSDTDGNGGLASSPTAFSIRGSPDSFSELPPLPDSPITSLRASAEGSPGSTSNSLEAAATLETFLASPSPLQETPSAESSPIDAEQGTIEAARQEALEDMDLMVQNYNALREQVAITSASVEENTERVIHFIQNHKCPAVAPVAETHANREELAKAESRIARLTRDVQNLSIRIQQAEVKAREEETANARSSAEVERLKAALEKERRQTENDLLTSEKHNELLTRKLSETVQRLAAANIENEDLRKNIAAYKGKGVKSSFVLVLLEMEARMFDPKLLAAGAEGGILFVDKLQIQMSRLYDMMARGTCVDIHIHLYLDLEKVINDLRNVGFISDASQLDEFLESVTQRDKLLTISDVTGEFGASIKIRGQMASFGSLGTCGMIFLGAVKNRKYLEAVAQWKNARSPIPDKLFVARSTPDPKDDPFISLGHDRLFDVEMLFPTSPEQWAQLMASRPPVNVATVRPAPNPLGSRTYLDPEPTGATQALPPAIQPNQPALVPNYVVHARAPYDNGSTPDPYRGQLGSPIPFTPMPTGVRYAEPDRAVRASAPSPPSTPHTVRTAIPPRPAAASAPPWQEYRAQHRELPEMLRRSVASGMAATPSRKRNIVFRKRAHSPSIGGSPPSTDEDRPLDPTIPPAERTHVARPPRFNAGSDTSFSAAGSAAGQHAPAPPSGFRVGEGYGSAQHVRGHR